MKVTTEHAETVGQGPTVGMEEGLLLDGITLHATDIAPGNIEGSSAVEANLAHSRLPLGNRAAVSAGVATEAVAVELFVQLARRFDNLLIEHFLQVRHGNGAGSSKNATVYATTFAELVV